jgi:hypothetical protein
MGGAPQLQPPPLCVPHAADGSGCAWGEPALQAQAAEELE